MSTRTSTRTRTFTKKKKKSKKKSKRSKKKSNERAAAARAVELGDGGRHRPGLRTQVGRLELEPARRWCAAPFEC